VFDKDFAEDLIESEEVVWLIYEVMVFYSSMFAIILLMAISRWQEFVPLRDRVNLASLKKAKTDYLLYIELDLHWFMILV
jgi:hypothetical protein